MATYAEPTDSQSEAINVALSTANFGVARAFTSIASPDEVPEPWDIVGVIAYFTGGGHGAQTYELASAEKLIARMPNALEHSSFEFVIINQSDGDITLNPGEGIDIRLPGTEFIGVGETQIFRGIVTETETPAIDLIGLLVVPEGVSSDPAGRRG